jgi:hypothetical protein
MNMYCRYRADRSVTARRLKRRIESTILPSLEEGDRMLAVDVAHTPFYSDWIFWSVVVSAIAIILSQLPPLHVLVRRPKLEVESYGRILLLHKIANPNAQLHLLISNVGGREVRIRGMSLADFAKVF